MPKHVLVRNVPISQLEILERERKRWQRKARFQQRKGEKLARITRNDVLLVAIAFYVDWVERDEGSAANG